MFIILSLIIFHKSLSVFFFQDDFFLISLSRAATLKDIFQFFIPRNDVIYFRPISLQMFYFLMFKIFGMKLIYYHLVQILIHSLNGLLIFNLTKKILKNEKIAFIASFFFVTSWTHFYELTWTASTFNSVGLLFVLLFILSYLTSNLKRFFVPEVFLILSLLSVETAVIAPILLFLSLFMFARNKFDWKRSILHLVLVFAYLVFRFIIHKVPATDSYSIGFSPLIVKNIIIFFLWLINFPEIISVHLTIRDFPFVSDWFAEKFPIYSILISETLVFLFLVFIYILIKNRRSIFNKINFFGALWFLIAILPIIIIPKRVYPYYPFIAQAGFWIIFGNIILQNFKYLLVKVFVLYFIFSNLATMWFTNENHWIFSESYQSKFYVEDLLRQFPTIRQKGHNILINAGLDQTKQALSRGLAFNVALNNYKIKFYFDEKDVGSGEKTCFLHIPKQIPNPKVKQDPLYWRGQCLHTAVLSCFCPPEY